MQAFSTVILAIQMLAALVMIGLILIQHGKGADMGAAFGSGGGSGSLFGASGSANFLSRSTGVLAAVFFVCTLALAYLGNTTPASTGSVLENTPAASIPAPAALNSDVPAPVVSDVPAPVVSDVSAPVQSQPAAPAVVTPESVPAPAK